MNRQKFLFNISKLFDDLNDVLIESYKMVLADESGTEINYAKLYKIFLTEYKYRVAPMPAWFAEHLSQVKIPKPTNNSYGIDIEQAKREGRLLAEDLEEGWFDVKTKIGICRYHDPVISNAYLARQGKENEENPERMKPVIRFVNGKFEITPWLPQG